MQLKIKLSLFRVNQQAGCPQLGLPQHCPGPFNNLILHQSVSKTEHVSTTTFKTISHSFTVEDSMTGAGGLKINIRNYI